MSTLHRRLQDVFERSAERPAVAGPKDVDISYGALGSWIAGVQAQIAVAAPRAVGILCTRCPEAYVGVLAAFFAGIPFVPLNPALPVARLQRIVRDGHVGVVIHAPKTAATAAALACPLIDVTDISRADDGCLSIPQEVAPCAIAYAMFTSGSTGDPKGVPVSYGSLAHYVETVRPATGIDAPGRFSQLFDLSFDLAMHDIFVALACGGTIVPAGDMDLMMPHAYIAKKRLDYWFSVPMLARSVLRGQAGKPPAHLLRMALFCGEPLPGADAEGFRALVVPGAPVHNLYGPTEATIALTCKTCDPDQADLAVVPLGAPFGDNKIAIETENGSISVPADGVEGELLLGGPQVFDGYDPPQPVSCFTATDPRWYRSGDLVRVRDGELLHLGRKDSQIKLRGYRIELGDIEAAFRRTFECAAAAIVLGEGEKREIAVAYVRDAAIDDLTALGTHLPSYMMPARTLRLDAMPVNVNGKTDRRALALLDWPV